MKKLIGMLLVLFVFISINSNAQVSEDTKEIRNTLVNTLEKTSNETVGFKLTFSEDDKTMIVSANLKINELDELPPTAAELFWDQMFDQWTPDVRLGMTLKLKITYFEFILYNTKGVEIGRYKDDLLNH